MCANLRALYAFNLRALYAFNLWVPYAFKLIPRYTFKLMARYTFKLMARYSFKLMARYTFKLMARYIPSDVDLLRSTHENNIYKDLGIIIFFFVLYLQGTGKGGGKNLFSSCECYIFPVILY